MPIATRVSLEDFLANPEIDERRLELIDGEVYEKPMPTWMHGRLAFLIASLLDPFGAASVEVRAIIGASPDFDASAPIPDAVFYREGAPVGQRWMEKPPHVAVEILSPGQSRLEMRAKLDLYVSFGVESVWLVDPDRRTIDLHEAGARRILGDGDILTTPVVPGLALDVKDLFDRANA